MLKQWIALLQKLWWTPSHLLKWRNSMIWYHQPPIKHLTWSKASWHLTLIKDFQWTRHSNIHTLPTFIALKMSVCALKRYIFQLMTTRSFPLKTIETSFIQIFTKGKRSWGERFSIIIISITQIKWDIQMQDCRNLHLQLRLLLPHLLLHKKSIYRNKNQHPNNTNREDESKRFSDLEFTLRNIYFPLSTYEFKMTI